MTRDRRALLGVALGIALAGAVLLLAPGRATGHRPGPILSECDGPLRELVIHYSRDGAELVAPTYRDLLRQLPAEVTVHVVCPAIGDFDDLVGRIGPAACALRAVPVGHAVTCWSRDRWVALGDGRGTMTLVAPRAEEGADLWPPRAGDSRVAEDLARALHGVAAERSFLYFDGGDFAADGGAVFVAPALRARNVGRSLRDASALEPALAARLGRAVVLLDGAPDHHVAMIMTPVGNRTVLVGDPSRARALLSDRSVDAPALTGAADDLGPEMQQRFDAVADACARAGYRVVRIPVVPGRDTRAWLTYVNVLLDERDGRRVVYLPVYRHTPALNAAAGAVWRDLGYEVRPVDCTALSAHFGALGCLVNVLRR